MKTKEKFEKDIHFRFPAKASATLENCFLSKIFKMKSIFMLMVLKRSTHLEDH
jgi:hypothetical protein